MYKYKTHESKKKKKKENLRRISKVFVFVLLEQEFNEPRVLQLYISFYFFEL